MNINLILNRKVVIIKNKTLKPNKILHTNKKIKNTTFSHTYIMN